MKLISILNGGRTYFLIKINNEMVIINNETPIVLLTVGQLKEIIGVQQTQIRYYKCRKKVCIWYCRYC